MTNNEKLSTESKAFLENLSVYLFSSDKSTEEINGIVDELESHLIEAEANGKSTEKIIGKSPKEYMESIADVMTIDYRMWGKYVLLILLALLSIEVLPDVMEGSLSYSLMTLLGNISIGIIFLVSIMISFKYVATHDTTLKMQLVIFSLIGLVNIGMFVGLIYLDRAVSSPVIHFGMVSSTILGVLSIIFLIGLSIWSKTWILVVLVALMTLPDVILGFTPFAYENQLMISTMALFVGMAIYIGIVLKKERGSE